MKKTIVIYLFFIAFGFKSWAQDKTNSLSLRQCIETGIANNLPVQQSQLQSQSDEITWKQSKLDRLPNLNGSASQGINQGRSIDPFTNSYSNQQINFASYELNSGVVLFNGLAMQNTVKQNALNYQASKMDWQQAKDNLTINIILAYLQVLTNRDQLTQLQSQAALTKKQLERLELLNREGATSPPLVYDLRGEYANNQLAIINMQNALETSKISLAQLMNVTYDKNMELENIQAEAMIAKYEASPDSVYQTALEKFSLIRAVSLRTQSSEKALKAARGRLFPSLSLNGGLNTNYSSAATQSTFINTTDVVTSDYVVVNGSQSPVIVKQDNFSERKISYGSQLGNNVFTSLSLNLTIPIFNSLQQRNRIKLAQISLKNNVLIEKTTKTQLQQSIEQAYANMSSAYDRYKTLLEQVNAYRESFKAAEVRFNNGVGNSVDYLTAKNNLDRANVNLISAKYDYVLRTKILDYYQGKQLW
jgi:outer membrane protein